MTIDAEWIFYWLLAAMVAMPIVLIVRGLKSKPPAGDPRARGRHRPDDAGG
ncbi:MAG TPA: hypothetical protein PK375_06085 [Rhodocyclaceae bacterium]|nr:hypothetical protein [Rhodocyclaceae bacterium]